MRHIKHHAYNTNRMVNTRKHQSGRQVQHKIIECCVVKSNSSVLTTPELPGQGKGQESMTKLTAHERAMTAAYTGHTRRTRRPQFTTLYYL